MFKWKGCKCVHGESLMSGSPARGSTNRNALLNAVEFALELLEHRWLLSASAINSKDAVPFQSVVIDPSPAESPIMKILGDLTNSGKEDAIVGHETNFGPGGLFWYEFPASGNASDPWVEHTIDPTADVYESAAVANIDGKGYNDIVVAERGTIYLYQNPLESGGNVYGTWPKLVIGSDSVSNGASGHETYLADIDGDGKLDVVTSDAIYFQNSPTSWTTVDSPTNYNRTEKGTALFDSGSGLGAIDVAGTGNAGNNFAVGWYQNPRDTGGNARTGAWTFHAIGPTYTGYTQGGGISYATLDVNGDGMQDIVTDFGEGPSLLPGGLIWWQAPTNRATGTWIPHTIDSTSQYVHNIRIGDFNGDGTPEIFAFEQDQSAQERLNVYYNEGGTGQNWVFQTLATSGGQNEWLGDISGDGDLDVLNSRHGVAEGPVPINVYMNQLTPDGIVRPVVTTPPASQTGARRGQCYVQRRRHRDRASHLPMAIERRGYFRREFEFVRGFQLADVAKRQCLPLHRRQSSWPDTQCRGDAHGHHHAGTSCERRLKSGDHAADQFSFASGIRSGKRREPDQHLDAEERTGDCQLCQYAQCYDHRDLSRRRFVRPAARRIGWHLHQYIDRHDHRKSGSRSNGDRRGESVDQSSDQYCLTEWVGDGKSSGWLHADRFMEPDQRPGRGHVCERLCRRHDSHIFDRRHLRAPTERQPMGASPTAHRQPSRSTRLGPIPARPFPDLIPLPFRERSSATILITADRASPTTGRPLQTLVTETIARAPASA